MLSKWAALTLLVMLGLQGCRVSDNSDRTVQSDMQIFNSAKNFWVQEEADKAVKDGVVGYIASEALVPLVFDGTEHLLTAAEYNAGLQQVQPDWQTYFTDLTSFRSVMAQLVADGAQAPERLETATEANTVQLPADETGTTLAYVYDPYQLVYESN